MITIEVCDEQIESIITKELSQHLRFVKDDLEKGRLGMFSDGLAEDTKKLKKLAKALKCVLDWYGGNDD